MAQTAGARRRLFVAVPLVGNALGFALGVQKALPRTKGIRLLQPEQLHFTLAFIGEADEEKTTAARAVVDALPAQSGGNASLEGILLLPNRSRVRVIALGVADEEAVFSRLFTLVMDGLEASKVTRREKRPFNPHLTIARLKRPQLLEPMNDCGRAWFGVESVCLYESKLRREGAEYTVLARTKLVVADGQEIS